MSGGAFGEKTLEALVHLLNGRVFEVVLMHCMYTIRIILICILNLYLQCTCTLNGRVFRGKRLVYEYVFLHLYCMYCGTSTTYTVLIPDAGMRAADRQVARAVSPLVWFSASVVGASRVVITWRQSRVGN